MPLDRVTAAIASAARTIHSSDESLESVLGAIARAASQSIPGFDLAGVATVDSRGGVVTRAVTDPRVLELDELQYSLGEGPCLDALGVAPVVAAPRIRHEQRWPRYVAQAVRLGLRSQLAVRVALDENGTMGGINLYSTVSDEIDPEAEPIAELFALHVAAVLGKVATIDQLNQALLTRRTIGEAIGILMERYRLDEDGAFQFLLRASQTDNVKVRDLARGLVDALNAEHGRRA